MSDMQRYSDAGTGAAGAELMGYATGQIRPSRRDREVAERAREVRHSVQLRDFAMQGEAAVQARGAQLACQLIDAQREACGDDPEKLMATSRFVKGGIDRLAAIADGTKNPWGI